MPERRHPTNPETLCTLGELRAKVKAHLRRDQRGRAQVFTLGSVRFDMGAHELLVDSRPVNLTPTEYSICEFLALNHGQVFSLWARRTSVWVWPWPQMWYRRMGQQ
ncbi:hypothetical protein [Mobiluncus mulieris]|uniref:hypothetical protein n=1 Tax=Mobiluncus mulieris TaxID=2052 RepID=UPI00215DA088|nr:hypothetical protein [Mobiluncus mulieris]